MTHVLFKAGATLAMAAGLSGCVSLGGRDAPAAPAVVSQVSAQAQEEEAARVATLRAQSQWTFQGRVAVNKGRNGGNGRIDWQQDGPAYTVALSAPVTRQSFRLIGDTRTGAGRLEGLDGGTREGDDARELLLQATGWDIPVNTLPDWVRGLAAVDGGPAAQIERDAQGRPRRVEQGGWQVQYLDWYPAEGERPMLPRRIEAVSGDAKVRLVVDSWGQGAP